MNTMLNIKSLNMAFLHVLNFSIVHCTLSLVLHLNIPPPPPTWDNFLPNIPIHHPNTLQSRLSLQAQNNPPLLPIIT